MNLDLSKELDKGLTIFPTTRYQGSKRRLLPWVYRIFDGIEFETVLDGFGGSASTSYLFKLMGKKVCFNDILRSNYQTGLALIENDFVKLEDSDIEFLFNSTSAQIPSFISDTFEDIYYYPEENEWLDMIVFNIGQLSQIYEDDVLRKKRALAFHALFQACLSKRPFNLFHRKNLYLRKAEVTRTFGNKKTWEMEFPDLFQKFALESSSKVFSNDQSNKAFRSDILSLENCDYDLVYLDPPYQRPSEKYPKDYYSLYHFLEGIVDYDNWFSKVDYSKKHRPLRKASSKLDGLDPLERFSLILEKFSNSIIAISYGDPGKPSIGELKGILTQYKKDVRVFATEFSYKLNRKNGTNMREVLLVGS